MANQELETAGTKMDLRGHLPQGEPSASDLYTLATLENLPTFSPDIETYIRRTWSEALAWHEREVALDIRPAKTEMPVICGPGYVIDVANLAVTVGSASGRLSKDDRGYEIFRVIVGLPLVDELTPQDMSTPLFMAKGLASAQMTPDCREQLEHPLIREYVKQGPGNKQLVGMLGRAALAPGS